MAFGDKIGEVVTTQTPTLTVKSDPAAPLKIGTYVFSLAVEDNSGNRSPEVRVKVAIVDTKPPTAVLKAPEKVAFGDSFDLDGTGSSDEPPGKVVRWIWTLVSVDGQ